MRNFFTTRKSLLYKKEFVKVHNKYVLSTLASLARNLPSC